VSKMVSFDQDPSRMQDVAGIEWMGVDDKILADDLLARRQSSEDRSKSDVAKDFLRQYLASGPAEHTAVRKAAKHHGIYPRTLERARQQIGWTAIVGNLRAGGKSIWGLDGQSPEDFVVENTTPAKTKLQTQDDDESPSEAVALDAAAFSSPDP
jgi:hypothetical protein